jgi:hypothetical protein
MAAFSLFLSGRIGFQPGCGLLEEIERGIGPYLLGA